MLISCIKSNLFRLQKLLPKARRLHYEQGQSPKPNIREYFYFIDHQGQLFMDDARIKNFTSCFKEKKFLEFFFQRLRINETGRYEKDFPYLSPCGRERNYIRVDDRPIVYTHIVRGPDDGHRLLYGYAGDLLSEVFQPEQVCMITQTGRVYHPAPERTGGIGLIKSSLAIELSKHFHFHHGDETQPPTHLTFDGKKYTLTNNLVELMNNEDERFRTNAKDYT